MSQYDFPSPLEKNNEQIIAEAVAILDAYDSPRARRANTEFHASGEASKVIKTPDRSLTFFGSFHTADSESQTVKDLRADLRETLSRIRPEDITLMIEGRHADEPYDREQALGDMEGVASIDEAIERFGESGVALWCVAEYARENPPIAVEVSSPEAPEVNIANGLKAEFAAEDIAVYLVLRRWTTEFGGRRSGEYTVIDIARQLYYFSELSGVEWIHEKKSDQDLRAILDRPEELNAYAENIVNQFLSGLNARLGLSVTLSQLRERRPGDVLMKEINKLSDPLDYGNRQTNVNKVAARWNGERDRFLVQSIAEAMKRGKKPYVIFGASHATHCEPALQVLAELAK